MAEPTPGPWAVCEEPPNDSWCKDVTVFCPAEGTRVADACVLNPRHKEDARQIAAAPATAAERDRLRASNAELLEALEAAAKALDSTADYVRVLTPHKATAEGIHYDAQTARAAIERAVK